VKSIAKVFMWDCGSGRDSSLNSSLECALMGDKL
jgi:hypothetical protein